MPRAYPLPAPLVTSATVQREHALPNWRLPDAAPGRDAGITKLQAQNPNALSRSGGRIFEVDAAHPAKRGHVQLTACSTASPTNRADGDLVRRTGKDWPGDRHSWPLRTSAAHRGSARASEAVPEAHFSGLLPDFRSPGLEPGATRVLGCISAVAWGLCRTCQVLDVNPPLTCGKLGSCTRHALVLKDARTLSPPRVCVPALPSPQGSETVAGESTLPARPRAGVSRTQPRSGQRRAGRAFVVAAELTHSLRVPRTQ